MDKPFFLTGSVKLTSGSSSSFFEINPAGQDMFIYGINVSAIDDAGKDVFNDTVAKDRISVSIADDNGVSYMNNPIPLSSLSASNDSIRFPGFTFVKDRRYTVTIAAQPSGTVTGLPTDRGSYPLNIAITFLANKYMSDAEYTNYIATKNQAAAQ